MMAIRRRFRNGDIIILVTFYLAVGYMSRKSRSASDAKDKYEQQFQQLVSRNISSVVNDTSDNGQPKQGPSIKSTDTHIFQSDSVVPNGIGSGLHKAWSKVPVLEAAHFPRLLTPQQLKDILHVLQRTTEVFDHYHIEYIIGFGTLLGSYISHSILAWDDDVDILIHRRYWSKLQAMHENGTLAVEGLQAFFLWMLIQLSSG